MKEAFIDKRWKPSSLVVIQQANEIIAGYLSAGYKLTLRQLYYQFVARGLIENNMKSYGRLGSIINDARLAGLVDWSAIEDRTRNLMGTNHSASPGDTIRMAEYRHAVDKWQDQEYRVEIWVEKEALTGVIQRVALEHDCNYFACRGYVSQSEQYDAGKRFAGYFEDGQKVLLLHLGDHDPSGMDMTRDNRDRLGLFTGFDERVEVRRIALNMDQVEEYDPPPNPAKQTDSRCTGYIEEFGESSWELDALEPQVIHDLIAKHINSVKDVNAFERRVQQQRREREEIRRIGENYNDIVEWLRSRDE